MATIHGTIAQYLLQARDNLALIGHGYLVPNRRMNYVSWPAEIYNDRYSASAESFENYAGTIVTEGRKHKHIRRSQSGENLRMTEPAGEIYSGLDAKRFHEVLEAASLRAVSDHREMCQSSPQGRSSRPQSKIASLPRHQTADEDEPKLRIRPRLRPRVIQALRPTNPWLGYEKELVTVLREFSICLRRGNYDRRCVPIGRANKRHISVQPPQTSDPFLLVRELTEARRPR
jgi:hypothetical protein